MSEFYKRKMRTYFSLFDFDKDGVLSREEWDQMPVLFANFENADKKKAEHLKTIFDNVSSYDLECRRSRMVTFTAIRLRGPGFKPRPGQKFENEHFRLRRTLAVVKA